MNDDNTDTTKKCLSLSFDCCPIIETLFPALRKVMVSPGAAILVQIICFSAYLLVIDMMQGDG